MKANLLLVVCAAVLACMAIGAPEPKASGTTRNAGRVAKIVAKPTLGKLVAVDKAVQTLTVELLEPAGATKVLGD